MTDLADMLLAYAMLTAHWSIIGLWVGYADRALDRWLE